MRRPSHTLRHSVACANAAFARVCAHATESVVQLLWDHPMTRGLSRRCRTTSHDRQLPLAHSTVGGAALRFNHSNASHAIARSNRATPLLFKVCNKTKLVTCTLYFDTAPRPPSEPLKNPLGTPLKREFATLTLAQTH